MATQSKEEFDPEDVHRLHDMLVQEVSLVDRAANKQKFLILKRNGTMEDPTLGPEVVENDDGAHVAADTTPPSADAADADVAKTIAMPSEVQAGVLSTVAEVLSRLTAVGTSLKAQTTEAEATGLPKAMADEIAASRVLLESLADKFPVEQEKAEGTEEGVATTTKVSAMLMLTESLERLVVVATAAKSASADESGGIAMPTAVGHEVAAVAMLLGGILERYPAVEEAPVAKTAKPTWLAKRAPSPERAEVDTLEVLAKAAAVIRPSVKKAGAKMASARLDKFRSTINDLLDLLKDLAPDDFDELVSKDSHMGGKDKKKAKGKKAKAKDGEKPDGKAPPFGGKAEKTTKEATPSAATLALEKTVADQQAKLTKQAAEIKQLSKSFDLPNSRRVESGTETPSPVAKKTQVSWPIDMNRPINRSNIKKEHWFDDEE